MTDVEPFKNTPKILSPIGSYNLREDSQFSFSIANAFYPQNESLEYTISENAPVWLYLDKESGHFFGKTPTLTQNKAFKITITAKNNFGEVKQSFILKVICTDIVETLPPTLELLYTLKRHDYGSSHLHPYGIDMREYRDLLEYIFEFYQQPKYLGAFYESLQSVAKELNIRLETPVTYEEFKLLIEKIHPDFENELHERVEENCALLKEKVSRNELQNLFRQGSQPLGVVPQVVWNYLAAPNLQNWGSQWTVIDEVLRLATDDVIELKKENLQELNIHRPTLTPKPKGVI